MPFKGLRSRPNAHQHHNSSVGTSSEGQEKRLEEEEHTPIGPFKRLSLNLTKSNDGRFDKAAIAPALAEALTSEPEEIEPELDILQQTKSHRSATPQQDLQANHFSPPIKPHRFSLLKFRHASDPQLSTAYRASTVPQLTDPSTPKIITTSPTTHLLELPVKKRTKPHIFSRTIIERPASAMETSHSAGDLGQETVYDSQLQPQNHQRLSTIRAVGAPAPPAYGDESTSSLAIPVNRLSDSSRSDGSSGDQGVYAQTTTTHTISTTTTFFRLRRKKDKGPLFPLPLKIRPPSPSRRSSVSRTPQEGENGRKSISPSRNVRFGDDGASPTHSMLALTNAPFGAVVPTVVRKESLLSDRSGTSTPSLSLAPPRLGKRGRSSTLGSIRRSGERLDESPSVPTPPGRTSTSTTGRKSFGDLFSLSHRLRQNSEPPLRNQLGATPTTPGSKSNSIQIQREAEPEIVYPTRTDVDTPASYLEKLEAAVPRGSLATILCKSSDDFSKTCLRKYMRGFSYFGNSVDIAIRKMLMEVELPKETQQIDRLLTGFADRYHECNPGLFMSSEEAYFTAFSILLLHSDTHNKNNKKKMQKQEFVKNTQGGASLSHDILECFYDNVCYTPFIHFEDEVAINSHRSAAPKARKSLIKPRSSESLRGPVDPYNLILDNKLHVLRPSLGDVIETEDSYSSTGTSTGFDGAALHNCFLHSSVLQIVSARSRPDAFQNQATMYNPAEAQVGLVSIKVAKVGLIWRKDPKKKKAKRPWQEWGAILTDSKLYFFRDVAWVKKLVYQYETHQKQSSKRETLVFKPPLSNFESDALILMDDAVALLDSSYKKHKNAFVFIKHGGFEEVFLANSETEMNDWIAKLNYAATFRTAGVRIRGLMVTAQENNIGRVSRQNSEFSTSSADRESIPPPAPGQKVDPQLAWEIMYYRRQIINEKISDADEKLAGAQKELDNLLRNARHLQVLLPIQAKSREAIVLAAGRMSAKLKWTRVELWRTKCHRDILDMDLNQENTTAFPAPDQAGGAAAITPKKMTPLKNQKSFRRTNTDTSSTAMSLVSSMSPPTSQIISQVVIDRVSSAEHGQASLSRNPSDIGRRRSVAPQKAPLTGSPVPVQDMFGAKNDATPESHVLAHQASIIGSHRSKSEVGRNATPGPASEEVENQYGVDGESPPHKRPGTSSSDVERDRDRDRDRDRVGASSPETYHRERGGSIRRSLQRTLRDPHHSHQGPQHHLRGRKGRESGSSLGVGEEVPKSSGGDSSELKRSPGSFMVHGKKASVITLGSEWQNMSNEERLKLRKSADPMKEGVEDDAESNASGPSPVAEGFEDDVPTRRQSLATERGEDDMHDRNRDGDGDGDADADVFFDPPAQAVPSSPRLGEHRSVSRHSQLSAPATPEMGKTSPQFEAAVQG